MGWVYLELRDAHKQNNNGSVADLQRDRNIVLLEIDCETVLTPVYWPDLPKPSPRNTFQQIPSPFVMLGL